MARRTQRGWHSSAPLDKSPVKVQGITIKPGDDVVVLTDGGHYTMPYAGSWFVVHPDDPERTELGYWMDVPLGTGPGMHPGPYPMSALRHPDFLTGFIDEIDSA